MKKFAAILDEITTTRAAIEEATATERKLTDALYLDAATFRRLREANDPAELEQRRATEAELTQNADRLRDLKMQLYFLKHNAKIALYTEAVPVALEVLQKYKGKPYGEKTREKISDEVKSRTGCRFYISHRYSFGQYDFYPADVRGNDYNITVGPAGGLNLDLLQDNRIQLPALEDLRLWYIGDRYFDDIPGAICEAKAAYERAVKARAELEAACSAFKVYAVGGISSLNPRETIYNTLRV